LSSEIIPKKILVVDDEEDIAVHLSNILKGANYEVIYTTKGRDALELVKSFKPNLIILDILIPDMEGSEVASILTQDPATADITIIFLTGVIITKKEESWINKTGKHYLMAKPTTTKELLDKVKEVLSR
jgi:hypothetical protein